MENGRQLKIGSVSIARAFQRKNGQRDVAVLKETNSSSSNPADLSQVWSALLLSGAGIGDDPGAQIEIKAGRLVLSKSLGPVHHLVLGSSS